MLAVQLHVALVLVVRVHSTLHVAEAASCSNKVENDEEKDPIITLIEFGENRNNLRMLVTGIIQLKNVSHWNFSIKGKRTVLEFEHHRPRI